MEIEIEKTLWSTAFLHVFQLPLSGWYGCEICGSYLNKVYIYIINCLKDAGLLPENFMKLCCFCYIIKEYFGGNYHKGCSSYLAPFPLDGREYEYGVNIMCEDCGGLVGKLYEHPAGVMNAEKFEDVCDFDED